jgi:hypothetical protein
MARYSAATESTSVDDLSLWLAEHLARAPAADRNAYLESLTIMDAGAFPVVGPTHGRRERLGQIEVTVDMPPALADAPPQPGERVEQGKAPHHVRGNRTDPGPTLAEGIVTYMDRVPVDVDLATRQWDGYVAAMADSGWDLVEVPRADDRPDAVFIEDTVVMYRGVAVVTRPGADARKPEVDGVARVVESLGCPVVASTVPQRSTAAMCSRSARPSTSSGAAAPTARAFASSATSSNRSGQAWSPCPSPRSCTSSRR